MARKSIPLLDASWLYVESRETPMHVGCMAIFSPLPDRHPDGVKGLVERMRACKTFAPPFNYRVSSPKLLTVVPSWIVEENVDLDYHLRHSALPEPGGERELGTLISRLHSNGLDFHRPLWECHIIEGLSGGRFAMYMKMHHSLIDGVGAIRLMQRIFSTSAEESYDLPAPWAIGVKVSSRPSAAPVNVVEQMRHAWDTARLNSRSLPSVAKAFMSMAKEAVNRTNLSRALPFSGPKSILNGRVSGARRFATQQYTMERMKRVAELGNASVNDVFLAICAGSLRRYLLERQSLPDEPLTAGLPVSVRPKDDEAGGNAISFIIANLNTHVTDPVKRLQAICDSTKEAKQSLQKLPKEGINNYTMLLMAPMMMQLMTGLGGITRPIFNTVISNVPGPDKPLYFSGAQLQQFYPLSLIPHGQALNITVVSYAGQFNVAFTGDHDALPSMQRLSVYTGDALAELEQALQALGPTGLKAGASEVKKAKIVKKQAVAQQAAEPVDSASNELKVVNTPTVVKKAATPVRELKESASNGVDAEEAIKKPKIVKKKAATAAPKTLN